MNIEQIASRISEVTEKEVSPVQLTKLIPQKIGDNGFIQINSKLEVKIGFSGVPNCVNLYVTGKKFSKYQATSCGESLNEAWNDILTTFEDMLVNPNRYYQVGNQLFDSR